MDHVDLWGAATAATYDEKNADMFQDDTLGPAVDLLAELASGGGALEFAAGTGRIALPLARRGVRVHAVDYSAPMVEQLRRKDKQGLVTTTVADMSTVDISDSFAVVFVAFNSLANLVTQDAQVECFRNAAKHLAPGGRFVVELWVPTVTPHGHGRGRHVAQFSDDGHVIDVFDPITQVGESRHYQHLDDGTVRYGHMPHRYVWPSELDLMAQLAGLEFEARHADWTQGVVVADSPSTVSVWRKPAN